MDLGFGNGVVDDIFFVPGYDISGSVVSQVKLLVGNWLHRDITMICTSLLFLNLLLGRAIQYWEFTSI